METLQEYSNDKITAQMENQGSCRVKFVVSVFPVYVKKLHKEAIKRINKEISIPGFRRGKAPDAIVMQSFGDRVHSEWKHLVTHSALMECFHLSNLHPLNERSVDTPKVGKCDLETGADITFLYEHHPHIPELSLSAVQVEKPEPRKPTEEEIKNTMDSMLKMSAKWEDIGERSIQEGDLATLDVVPTDDPTHKFYDNHPFEVKEGKMSLWVRRHVIGAKVGDVFEADSEPETGAPEEEAANFKPTKCRITIKEAKSSVVPKLDDAFFKLIGVKDLEEFKENVRKKLEKEAELEAEQELYKRLDAALLNHYSFEIPQSLFEDQRQQRVKQRIYQLQQQKKTKEEILSLEKEIEAEVSEEVLNMLRLAYLHRRIADEAAITVTLEEVNNMMGHYPWVQKHQLGAEQLASWRSRFEDMIWNEKVRNYLAKQVTIC